MNNQEEFNDRLPRWLSTWDPRTKLIGAIFYIFGVISLAKLEFVVAAYLLSFICLLVANISVILLGKRYLIITPFLLLMTVPLLWQQGEDAENLIFAVIIVLKAFTSMTVITILLESQSLDQLVNSLGGLKIPPMLITILLLSYRYVFMFLDDIQRMIIAAKSRYFRGGLRTSNLKVYGQLTAGLLVKAIERSENMFQAMESRGFDGKLKFSKFQTISRNDIQKTTLAMATIIIIIVADKV